MIPPETNPWSSLVRYDEAKNGLKLRLEADAGARDRIARALSLKALSALDADLTTRPDATGVRLEGRFRAEVTQVCGVTVEPFDSVVEGDIAVSITDDPKLAAYADDPEAEIGLDTQDPPDLAQGGKIDLGAYVVEHLSLELDPYPRKPGVEWDGPAPDEEPSPFAALSKLKRED